MMVTSLNETETPISKINEEYFDQNYFLLTFLPKHLITQIS